MSAPFWWWSGDPPVSGLFPMSTHKGAVFVLAWTRSWTNRLVFVGLSRSWDVTIILSTFIYTPWFSTRSSYEANTNTRIRPTSTWRCFSLKLTTCHWSSLSSIHPLFIYLIWVDSDASTRYPIVREYGINVVLWWQFWYDWMTVRFSKSLSSIPNWAAIWKCCKLIHIKVLSLDI